MTWTTHPTVSFGDMWSATQQNTYIKANLDHVAETRFLPLSILEAAVPDTVAAAARDYLTSSGAAPKPLWPVLRFDGATDEGRVWAFKIPRDFGGSPVIVANAHMSAATTDDDVVFYARVACIGSTDSNIEAKVFAAANTATVASPTAADEGFTVSVPIATADGMSAGDFCILLLARDADNGADTATGDVIVSSVELQYSLVST